ncbi:LLM class F420-dependent oxidoreductase [Actinocorallia sp. API 0066]|uniref:LLM class F420-dependent oxidoreductase n=1 Tax=Actinocorallia sp. API 0066 TaxID=2896846 RepID=UPI001E44BBFE|nr:LLM class F420-dependent oxidoreductase [Actinocorallia sp. API 0066]MCD0451281.1 LLM class F420-dependent oxidoreductase [Actinocorallia sp. API 0066]
MNWGLTIPLPGVKLADHRALVEELAGLGYTDVWSAETNGYDGFTPLALASQWAPTLRLGPAIVPVYTRGPALLAQQAATIADLAPGRFILGIGTSSDTIVERWNGIPFTEPFAKVRDTLRFLRRALSGEKVTDEALGVKGFRLESAPEVPPQIALAALRPGMLRLAAREADAAITNWLSATDVAQVREAFHPDKELLARLFVAPTSDAEEARNLGRWLIASYLNVPVYRAFHEWLGRGEALRPMHEAWASGDRQGALKAIPDEVVDALVIHGTPESCRAQIRSYVSNGLTTPVLMPLPTSQFTGAEAVRALAPTAP